MIVIMQNSQFLVRLVLRLINFMVKLLSLIWYKSVLPFHATLSRCWCWNFILCKETFSKWHYKLFVTVNTLKNFKCVSRGGWSLTHSARTSPAVHPGMRIWGVKGVPPPFFCLILFFVLLRVGVKTNINYLAGIFHERVGGVPHQSK